MEKAFSHWQIAYRMKGEEKFILIDNPSWAWTADPFPIRYKGNLYIFAELFLYKSERNGIIGYCQYENGKFGEWQVSMDRHWHLSYPNVWIHNDELYMCPESYQANEIAIYRLLDLPDKWEKVKTILMNKECVDTTFIKNNNQYYMFTSDVSDDKKNGKLLLYIVSENYDIVQSVLIDNNINSRQGGNFFEFNDSIIRVSQDSDAEYGKGLIFSETVSFYPCYKEKIIKKIYADSLPIDNSKKYCGIHTYNRFEDIEVVDLKYNEFTEEEKEASDRVKKVFLNKY